MPHLGLSSKKIIIFIVIFVCALLAFMVFGGRGLVQIYQLKAEKEKIRANNAVLREENQKLTEKIARLRHNKEEIEKIAREDLGLAKKGEIIYQFEK